MTAKATQYRRCSGVRTNLARAGRALVCSAYLFVSSGHVFVRPVRCGAPHQPLQPCPPQASQTPPLLPPSTPLHPLLTPPCPPNTPNTNPAPSHWRAASGQRLDQQIKAGTHRHQRTAMTTTDWLMPTGPGCCAGWWPAAPSCQPAPAWSAVATHSTDQDTCEEHSLRTTITSCD